MVTISISRKASMKAKARLMREAAELQTNPHPHMNAQPLENDIFTWHANIYIPRLGVPFHFIIEFSDDYPRVAPEVRPATYIEHPNVFGDYICLDILTMSEETETTPYRGWTPAYTVRSLLVQLQCFLFDVEVNKYDTKRMTKEAKKFLCHCHHSGRTPHPFVEMKETKFEAGRFYRICRPALIRKGVIMNSGEICTLEEHVVVEIIQTDGNRARVRNAELLEQGWMSAVTSSGKMLSSVETKAGLYRTFEFTKLFALQENGNLYVLQENGSLVKDTTVRVTGFVAFGSQVLCISESEDFEGQVFIDSGALIFIREIAEEIEEHNGVLTEDNSWFHEMYGLVLDIVFDMCDSQTAQSLAQVHEDFQAKLDTCRAYQMRNFRCFYTLKNVQDPATILGIGVKCEVMPKRSRATGRKRDVLQRMHPSFDLLSLEAFEKHNCITSIWKDVKFNAFMPLYLCPEHGKRSLPAAEKCIVKMWQMENKNNSLSLSRLLETFAKLMNTTIVNMMKNVMDLEVEELQLFDSIKALEGYMSFHHLLLAFTQRKPQLIALADEKVKKFIDEKACRDKEVTPDLGELVVCLSISSYKWEDFLPSLMEELFQRNSRWILAKYPGLRKFEDDGKRSCIRMTQSFQATITGKRLSMFQRFFMKEIACPVALEGNPDKCKILFEDYNSRYGRPVPGMARRLQLHSRKVLAASDWWDYFELVGFCPPSSISLSNWLRNSVKLSSAREYHNTYQTLKYTENHVESPEYSLHLNHRNCCCAGGQVFNLDNKEGGTLLKPKNRIDIAFVVDCTGSMSSWLHEAKHQIKKIIQDVTRKTQFKNVRFGLVCYRDHGVEKGYGKDAYITKPYEFTSSVTEMQQYVDSMRTGGGGNCEALSCGLHAAACLKWNENAMRVIIHIGDQCAHGMGSAYDSFDNGCPDGHDALTIAHNLAKKGVVIYNVDCGYEDGLRQTFYHTLSHLTGGVCVNMHDAGALSKIVVGATMEEEVQNTLSLEIAEIYDDVVARHPGAREDQLVYEIMHRLKMQKVMVKCMLGNQEFGKYEKKQIECIAFCTDLTEVKAMQDQAGEYFDFINVPKNQIVSEQKRFASERQVRTCLKRISKTLEIKAFENNGCKYAQKRWKIASFKARWEPFKEMSPGIGKFAPWKPLSNNKLLEAARNIKRAGELSKKGTKHFNNQRTGIKSSTNKSAGGRKQSFSHGLRTRSEAKKLVTPAWTSMMKDPTVAPQHASVQAQPQQPAYVQAQTQQPAPPAQAQPQLANAWAQRLPTVHVQPQRISPARRSPSQRTQSPNRVSQPRRTPARPAQPRFIPSNTARILSITYNPRMQKLGLSLNMLDGVIASVHPGAPFVRQYGICAQSRIIALNNSNYNASLWTHLCNMGNPFTITFAVPTNSPVLQQMPVPQNAPVNFPNQRLNVPVQQPASRSNLRVQGRNSAQRRSTSSSGSSPQRSISHSRTPERTAPAQFVPDLDKSLKITSVDVLSVETMKIRFQRACVFPKEIKLINQHCAYAIFDSTFSTRLAARTDLGRNVKVQLTRESRV